MSKSLEQNNGLNKQKLPIFVHGDIDDYGLNPYEFRLYARIVRRSGTNGESFESIKNMAKGCSMSEGKLKKSLEGLVAINAVTKKPRPGRPSEYKPNPFALWRPRSDTAQVTQEAEIDPQNLTVDPQDLSPRSDMTYEVTPISLSTDVSPNNGGNNFADFDEVSPDLANEVSAGNKGSVPVSNNQHSGKESFSASSILQAVENMGVNIQDGKLQDAVRKYPQNVSPAIAALEEAIRENRADRPTQYLTAGIREKWEPKYHRAKDDYLAEFNAWFNWAKASNFVLGSERTNDGGIRIYAKNDQWYSFEDLRYLSPEELAVKVSQKFLSK